jgi:predicted Zn-dependent protease
MKPGTQKEHTKGYALYAAKCSTQGSPVKDTAAQAESISLTGKSILIKAVKPLQRSSGEKKAAAKYQDPVFA